MYGKPTENKHNREKLKTFPLKSGYIQEATNECINKKNSKSLSLCHRKKESSWYHSCQCLWVISFQKQSKNIQVWLCQTEQLLHSKRNYQEMKIQTIEQEKRITNHISDKELVCKNMKTLYYLIEKNSIKKWTDIFHQEDIQMANMYRKRCSISLVIRDMQIKTKMVLHLMPVRMATIKKKKKARKKKE